VRSLLHRDPRRPSEPARTSPARRHPRTTGLLAGGLATLALAAAPVGESVGETIADTMAAAVPTGWVDDGEQPTDAATTDTTDATTRTVTAEPIEPPADAPMATLVDAEAPVIPERPAGTAASEQDEDAEDAVEAEDAVDAEAAADDSGGEDGAGDEPAAARVVWDDLADCESGDWDRDGNPIEGTARWDYGLEFAHEGFEQFQGGLNFHPDTWNEFRDPDMPDDAGYADREQEIIVGERVLEAQGWQAWPVCSRMLGLR
jgi:resuscitation-promoting factor RpfB